MSKDPRSSLTPGKHRRQPRVRPNRVGGRIPQPHQAEVDELPVDVDVRQQSAVSVSAVQVEAQAQNAILQAALQVSCRFDAETFPLPAVPRDFRRVDADQPDSLVSSAMSDPDRVAVGDLDDSNDVFFPSTDSFRSGC